jgi:hypothetical protein
MTRNAFDIPAKSLMSCTRQPPARPVKLKPNQHIVITSGAAAKADAAKQARIKHGTLTQGN